MTVSWHWRLRADCPGVASMMAVLLGAGVGLLLAGFAAIVYGIPVKEFSFGNTMILSGVVAACSGLIMLALWVMTRELQNVARRLGGGISVAPQMRAALQPSLAPSAPRGPGDAGDFAFSRDQQPGEISVGEAPPPRRGRTTLADANGAPREAAPQVTVLKSGVVDGMAYSLYSDGSIEAQMPEGMMRFASIDELRAHLDQRP